MCVHRKIHAWHRLAARAKPKGEEETTTNSRIGNRATKSPGEAAMLAFFCVSFDYSSLTLLTYVSNSHFRPVQHDDGT